MTRIMWAAALTVIVVVLPACDERDDRRNTTGDPDGLAVPAITDDGPYTPQPNEREEVTEFDMVHGGADRKPAALLDSPHDAASDGCSHPNGAWCLQQMVDEARMTLHTGASAGEKAAALGRLEGMEDPSVIDLVMEAMNDPEPDVRVAGLEVLRHADHHGVNQALIQGLSDDDLSVVTKAAEVMAASDSPHLLPTLEYALASDQIDIQEDALLTLEDVPDLQAVDLLIEKGAGSGDEFIREVAFDSIEYITDQRFEDYDKVRQWWIVHRALFRFDSR